MGLLLNDQIWLWSIAAERFNSEHCSGDMERPGDIVLSSMLRTGLHNWSIVERPSEALTQSMHYAACLADHLCEWSEREGPNVHSPALPAGREDNCHEIKRAQKHFLP